MAKRCKNCGRFIGEKKHKCLNESSGISNLDLNKIKDLYVNKKLSSLKIAKILGVCKYTILKRLKEMGIKRRKRGEWIIIRKGIILDKDKIKDLYINQKKSVIEIGKIFRVSWTTIYNRLKKENIKIRSKSESHKGQHSSPNTEFKKGEKIVKNKKWIINQANSLRKFYQTPKGTQKKIQMSKIMKQVRAKQILPVKDTKIEIKIQNFLKQLGIEFFTHQYMKEIEHSYQCDILIPSMNLVIECDGDYWHKYPIGREIDKIRTSELIKKGFKVLRLWENEIKEMDLNKFKKFIK